MHPLRGGKPSNGRFLFLHPNVHDPTPDPESAALAALSDLYSMDPPRVFYQLVGPPVPVPILQANDCQLTVRQQPSIGKVIRGDDRNRVPLDPPPVVQLTVSRTADACGNYMISPTLFMHSTLIGTHGFETPRPVADSLTGSLSSSLHRLNDDNDRDGAFFIFGDLSIKVEGIFKLRFSLFDIHEGQVTYITSVESIPFRAATNYAGTTESTPLTRKFCNQGMRLRLRNPARILPKKRGPQSEDYTPRQYKTIRVSRSQEKSPEPSTPCQKSKEAAPISAQNEPKEFRPALSSTPTKSRTPLQNVPLPRRGTVSDHHPQSMFNQHGLSPEQHFPNSFAESQLGSIGSDNFSAQCLFYQDGFYNLPSNTPSTGDQMLWQGFGQEAEVTQSQVASRLSSQQTNYRQTPQYLTQHGVGEITPSNQQKDTPSGFSAIDDVQDIHGFGEIPPSNQQKDTSSGFSAIDDVQDIHGLGDIPPSWIYGQR